MSSWVNRLKAKMDEFELTQEELAKNLGVTRSAVGHWIAGTRQPPLKQFIKISTLLKTDPSWLQFGKKDSDDKSSNLKAKSNGIPILSWQEAIEANSKSIKKDVARLEYANLLNDDYYALEIKTDSMTSSTGISFNSGSYIIIDPNKPASHGSFVICMLPANKKEPIFRQHIVEGGIHYLKALNSQYPIQEIGKNFKILGTVVANLTMHIDK